LSKSVENEVEREIILVPFPLYVRDIAMSMKFPGSTNIHKKNTRYLDPIMRAHRPKVHKLELMASLGPSPTDVAGLEVSMAETSAMETLHSGNEAAAKIEEVFE
jgi:hypothetical protein